MEGKGKQQQAITYRWLNMTHVLTCETRVRGAAGANAEQLWTASSISATHELVVAFIALNGCLKIQVVSHMPSS
eukprot:8892-Heterococcus_DN1.PRE.2